MLCTGNAIVCSCCCMGGCLGGGKDVLLENLSKWPRNKIDDVM